ncbi:MAG: RluA family pseudouridine synthase [Lachnospiraceae bacterium]|nr:RluA family pseudouridine synthase [Lachnospiraceae bacterium]
MKPEKPDILYEDNSIIVVRKPAGLATQTARLTEPDLVSVLKGYLGQSYLGIIHRLDQPVEGCLVFAKDKKCAGFLTASLAKEKTFHKKYLALSLDTSEEISEVTNQEKILIDFLKQDAKNHVMTVVSAQEGDAKKAVLRYHLIRRLEDGTKLYHIEIETGRFHQIRVQMAHAGHALLGDRKYGGALTDAQGKPVRNVCLCAYSLTFAHPVTGKIMEFTVLPKEEAYAPFVEAGCLGEMDRS